MRAATLVCSIRGLSLRVSHDAVNAVAFNERDTCRGTIDTRGRKTTYGKFALAKIDIFSVISQMFRSLLANTQQILPQASKPDLACFVSSDRACGGNLTKLFSSILRHVPIALLHDSSHAQAQTDGSRIRTELRNKASGAFRAQSRFKLPTHGFKQQPSCQLLIGAQIGSKY